MTVPVSATQFSSALAVRPADAALPGPLRPLAIPSRLAERLAVAFRRPLKAMHVAALSLVHWNDLAPLRNAADGSGLAMLLRAHPDVWALTLTPLISSDWDARTRLARLTDHFDIVERLGPPFSMKPFDYVNLLHLDMIGERYRLTLDQPGWLMRDGLLTLSLWDGVDRIFTLSFCLARQRGELVAYVGGIQGRRDDAALDRYRELTKAAHGVRPRDLLIKLFRMVCRAAAVDRILCVSDDIRYQKSRYFLLYGAEPQIDASYDQAWEERGAIRRDDGFFELPLQRVDRAAEDIPARKRAMYRQRYAMLEQLQQELSAAIANRLFAVKSHDVAFVPRSARQK
jgi:uncharacterized protein